MHAEAGALTRDTVRLAAVLVAVYGVVVLGYGAFYIWWSGDTFEVGRMAIRVAGAALIAWGLWRAERWAWWFAVVFSAVLTVIGAVGLVAGLAIGLFETRPYPAVDIAFFVVAIGLLTTAFVLLLLPASRRRVKSGGSRAVAGHGV